MATTTRRRKPKPIRATRAPRDPPEWAPLLRHVGPFLARWFMYMGRYRLDDGTHLHAYKHVDTRRYFHLHDDLRCFVFAGDEMYAEVPRHATMLQVFGDYGSYPSGQDEFKVYRSAVEVAEYLAELRDDDPVGEAPPDWRAAPEAVHE